MLILAKEKPPVKIIKMFTYLVHCTALLTLNIVLTVAQVKD